MMPMNAPRFRFTDISIRGKVLLVTFAASFVALFAVAGELYVFQLRNFRQTFERELRTLSRITADNCTAALAFNDAKTAGEVLAPPGLPETCQRGGHIPGAVNIPWSRACNDDGTFKDVAELRALYAGAGVTEAKNVITYCRIGERSAHSWFVLT